MSDNFNSLYLLTPLLLNNLATEDVNVLAHELHKQKCISESALQLILRSSEQEQIQALLHALVETAKSGWENSVVYCLQIIGKPKVAQIIDCWFHPEQSYRVNWIVASWSELLKHEGHIRESACFIASQKLPSEQWLVDFCCLIASEETDAESKTKVVEMLQSMISESDNSLPMTTGFEFEVVSSSSFLQMSSFKSETNEAATNSAHAKFERIQVENFEIESSSSSDSTEDYVEATANRESRSSTSSKPVEEDEVMSDLHEASSQLVNTATEESTQPTSECQDVEMKDETSPLDRSSPCMEIELVQREEIEPNDASHFLSEDIESTFHSLLPLLHTCLSGTEIKNLAKDIGASGHLSAETFQKIKLAHGQSTSENDLLLLLINGLKDKAKEDWKTSLLDAFQELDRFTLHDVIKHFCYKSNDDLCWLITNWDLLQDKKEDCAKIAEKLNVSKAIDEEVKSWLLHFIRQVMLAGDETLQQVTAALQSEPEEEEIELVQREEVEPNDASHSLSEDIESTFRSLLPLLHACLSGTEIKNLAKDIAASGHLSAETFQKIKLAHRQSTPKNDLLLLLINGLKDESKEDWKTSLLDAFQELDRFTLHDVIKHFCYDKPNDDLCWLINNWNLLQDRKEDCVKIAQKLNVSKAIDEEVKSWLLHFIRQVMLAGDETLQQVIAALQSEPEEEEDADIAGPSLMEQIDHILNPLLPMLQSCMTGKKIVALAKKLMVNGHFSRNSIKEFISISSKAESEETFTSFVNYFKEDAQSDWEEALLKVVSQGGLHMLHDVLKYYFFDKRETINWFLQSWDTLQDKNDEMLLTAQKLNIKIEINEKEKSWLLSYIYQVLQNGDDALEQVIAALSEDKTTKDDQVLLPATTDSYGHLSIDVDESLTPLVLLLTGCLSRSNLIDIVANLHVGEDMHLTSDSMRMLNDSADSNSEFQETIVLFIDCLKKDAKASWKTVFLNSLDEQELDVLHCFIRRFFTNPTRFLVWVLQQWKQLEIRKVKLVEIAHVREIGLDITSETELCVLQIITSTLQRGDNDLQWLVTKFVQETLHKEEKETSLEQYKLDERPTTERTPSSETKRELDDDIISKKKKTVLSTAQMTLEIDKSSQSRKAESSVGGGGNSLVDVTQQQVRNQVVLDGSQRAVPVSCMANSGDPAEIAPEKREQSESGDASHASPKPEEIEKFYDASSYVYGSKVKILTQEYEVLGEEVPPINVKNGARNNPEKGITSKKNKDPGKTKNLDVQTRILSLGFLDLSHVTSSDGKLLAIATAAAETVEKMIFRGKNKQPPLKRNIPTKHKKAIDEEITYSRLQKLRHGECFVEFRARMADPDFAMPEGSILLLYLENETDSGTYPMQFYPKLNEYRLLLPLNVSNTLTYKYCIENVYWEYLICSKEYQHNATVNRQWTLNSEQKRSRYAVKFDVVVFKQCSYEQYLMLLSENVQKFLNCQIDLDESSTNENIVMHMHNVYRNWLIGLDNDLYTTQKVKNLWPFNMCLPTQTKVNAVTYFLGLLFDNVDHTVRVLSMLAFATALDKEIDLGENVHLCSKICRAFSVDNIKEENFQLLVTHLNCFSKVWVLFKKSNTRRTSLLGVLEKFFEIVSKIPESLLIFPLIKTLQSVFDARSDPNSPPTIASSKSFVNKEWKFDQKVIVTMGEIVLNLVEKYPWIQDMYAKLLTLETTSEILMKGSQLSTMVDVNVTFIKLQNFWNKIATEKTGTPDFNEGAMTIVTNYITTKIQQAITKGRSPSDERCAIKWINYCEVILKSLSEFVAHHSKESHVGCVIFMLELMNDVMEFAQMIQKSHASNQVDLKLSGFLRNLMIATDRLFKTDGSQLSWSEITLWNRLSDINWTTETTKDMWKLKCGEAISFYVKQKYDSAEALINFYGNDFEEMKPSQFLMKCFTDVLTSKVEDDLAIHWSSKLHLFSNLNLLNVIWEVAEKKWTNTIESLAHLNMDEIVLNFLEQWPPATFFLCQLCKGFKKEAKKLTQNKQIFMNTISSSISRLMGALRDGNIIYSCLMMIFNIEAFWQCYDATVTYCTSIEGSNVDFKYFSETKYDDILDLRNQEVATFHSVKKYLEEFVKFASFLKGDGIVVDCDELLLKLDEQLLNRKLSDLVECKKLSNKEDIHKVVFFSVSANELKMIIHLTQCLKSTYARKVVRETTADFDKIKMSISSFLDKAWTPAYNKILCTCEELDDGSISFATVEQLFEQNLAPNLNQVKVEVNVLFEISERSETCLSNSSERANQVHNYLIIKRQQSIATALVSIKEKLELKGKFETFQQPLNVGESLNSITEDTIKAVSILENVTEQQLQVLQIFCEGEILMWLKEHMKDRSEVKVMSDLAMISAGETDMEVDRVSCFLSAVMGFSPLIFDLPEDAGLDELLSACRQVWKNVDRDQRLIEKWIDLSKQMEWLKNVKELHGSVEKSSLIRAREINERGIYVIGKEKKTIPTIDNCLMLVLPAIEETQAGETEASELERKKNVIKKLAQQEIPENAAKAAVLCAPSVDVDECYSWAMANIGNEALINENHKKFDEEDANVTRKIMLEKKKKVIRTLVQREILENAAKAAVQCVKSLDVDECYLWASDNITNNSLIVKNQKEFNKEAGILEMSLGEVHDLQSRLMLIAGEADRGKDDITRFTDILSNVESLAKAYVKLKQSGCLLFDNWTASIRCKKDDEQTRVTIKVSFHKSSPLSSSKEVLQEIKDLTDILQLAHKKWMEYLCKKRDEHYHLNHFNIHQLTYLCKKLSCNDESDFPDQVYQLLATVSSNLSFSDITDTLEEVTKINDEAEPADISILSDSDTTESKLAKKKKIIRRLVQQEIPENAAKAAVQCVPSLDIDECYLWALSNQCDESLIEENERNFEKEAGFGASSTDIRAIQDVINERINLTLDEVISRIQKDLNADDEGVGIPVKTVCERYLSGTAVTSLEDCISLEHLGQFLTSIVNTFENSKLPKRECPENFHAGKPNLVVCPKTDMWRRILSIYMGSPDQCLPSAAEVLVCSESTASEEIELLLRRAMQYPADEGKRIYCLACADDVSFNVAEEAENVYQQLNQMSGRNSEYRLVVLVSSLHHYITALFDEYRVDINFMQSDVEMKAYICKNLSTKGKRLESASVIDHDRNLVRLVCSEKAGMGKSLFVARCKEKLAEKFKDRVYWNSSIIRFLEKAVDVDDTITTLTHCGKKEVVNADPHFVHIDITPAVHNGVHKFLFDLVILGELKSSDGVIWRRCAQHFYALEYTFPSGQGQVSFANILDLFPKIKCVSPQQVVEYMQQHANQPDPVGQILMDNTLLTSDMYQRPYQYLNRYTLKEDLDKFTYTKPIPNALNCLQTLLKYCSVVDPSWAELSHFSKFLNTQLCDCENSYFLNIGKIEELDLREEYFGLAGFKQFVVRFMIRMSQDFATPSLKMDEDAENDTNGANDVYELHQLRRRWENDFHPYLFFNADRMSFSFVHFNISDQGDLCNPKTNAVFETNVMSRQLLKDLKRYKVKIRQDFDQLSREEKLQTLCNVFGVQTCFDPDSSYELTTDNVLKMLAIHMRFRCGIPVVIMGETGCGKTRMVEFMSKLKAGGKEDVQNMVVVKVHGGVTVSAIHEKVKEAVTLARANADNENLETILFLDEANTTEAIYAIKEIVCDATVHGETFAETELKIVAACNPYRKHSDDLIEKMDQSGLGFHVKTEDITDTFAGIPMRHLVYRVIPLPPSMQPLVWDFGQLNNDTEEIYINQMVLKLQSDINGDGRREKLDSEIVGVITKCLSASQVYMREKRDVCSFVSLRDVERTIQTFKWFYKHLEMLTPLLNEEKNEMPVTNHNFSLSKQALMHSLGICYHVTLNDRKSYREVVAEVLEVTEEVILNEIIACQNVFINAIELKKDVGRNEALRENVFMMVVCAEMRIPLFLVGKPGSSKSLAKTIVTDAMQGINSKSDLYKKLKQIHVLSFQCSAVSDAVGIEAVFNQCAQLQKNQREDEFVAVVVLDEIGLAEDSPKMPLKVLHPLLENASITTQLASERRTKVGFVGISNWALDPAKMNRGIFVTRGKPSYEDLRKTAEAIFESDKEKIQGSGGVIKALTSAYLKIYEGQAKEKEFFGLRDYYGLLKMMFAMLTEKADLDFMDIAKLVLRNFSGNKTDVSHVFKEHLVGCFSHVYNPKVTVMQLIHENLNSNFENRFLLLLTNQYSAVSLLPKVMGSIQDYQVVFGSSFPRDKDYTEVCRNINKIKVCMETGRTVVLLNLRDLYESLYDALNQHYVTFSGQNYVDLGLGGHRVKCRIAEKFRLIVIEEKDVVYEKFPIPLINRLEKHVFETSSVLSDLQTNLVNLLIEWAIRFTTFKTQDNLQSFSQNDTFPGYTDDTPASAVVSAQNDNLESTKKVLLQTASLDGVCRLSKTRLSYEAASLQKIYMEEQDHDNLLGMLERELVAAGKLQVFEVTSFSQMLHDRDRQALQSELRLGQNSIMLLTLQQISTERSFSEKLDFFFQSVLKSPKSRYILLIQCPQAQLNGNLIACAKYATMNKVKDFQVSSSFLNVVVVFLFTMERHINAQQNKTSFTSFHSQNCSSLYIDELKPSRNFIPPVSTLWNMTIANVFEQALQNIALPNSVLDLNRLVSDCIPEAMAKLDKDGTSVGGRNRVRILSSLCFKSGNSPAFLKILCEHVLNLVSDRDKLDKQRDLWIVEVACSPQGLQEGGSFKHAVWLYLRKVTAVAIAKIVSIIDADNNLDLMETLDNTDLWLQMFEGKGFLKMHWPAARLATTFAVSTQFNFSFPFFKTVFEQLHKQWKIIKERNLDNKQQRFIKAIRETLTMTYSLLELACKGKNAVTFTKSFIRDLVFQLYKRRSNDDVAVFELETVQSCVFSLFQARRKKGTNCNSLVEAFLLYKEIQSDLQSFASIIVVNSDILNESHEWIDEQLKHDEFVAHKLALASLIRKLHTDAPKVIEGVETCEKWKLLVSKAKPVAFQLVPESSDEIEKMWTNVVFVEIFLDQLVPASALQDTVQMYLSALAPHARRLSIGASKCKNLSEGTFLNILTKTLESCTKEIETRLLCEWQDITCRSCKTPRMKDPVLLPCGHYACQNCVLNDHESERCCPRCRAKVPAEAELEPVKLSLKKSEEINKFKSACTSFFLEYLSTFCFPATLDKTGQQQTLQSQNDLLKLVLQRLVVCEETAKKSSGLFNNFGLDLVARSYILKLLMGCNPNLVKELLIVHLETLTNDYQSKAILFDIYLRCVRNILHNEMGDGDDGIDDVSGEDADSSSEAEYALSLLHECEYTDLVDFHQLEHLDFCISMQYIVQVTVNSIHILHQGKSRSLREERLMTQLVSNVCQISQKQNFNKIQPYIVKETCRRHGIDALWLLLKSNMFKDLVPIYLIPDEDKTKRNYYLESDMLVLCGNSYINTKASLLRKITKPKSFPIVFQDIVHEIQQSGDSIFQVLLSLSMWTSKGDVAKALRNDAFKHMTGHLHAHFAGKPYQQLFNDVAESKLDCFKCDGLSDFMQHQLTELLTLIGVTFLWHGEGLLTDLAGLITDPEQYIKAFLPTMPLAGYFAIKGLLAKETTAYNTTPKAFLCPNGHLYFIGDCTKPNQAGICPDCRQPIGGQSYDKLHAGNRAGEITKESQAGYKLKSANSRPPATPERKLSKLSVCAIRFCLHAAMLLGSRNGKGIKKMIDTQNPSTFLLKHLVKDLNELAQYLGRSVDDTIIVMHEIVNRMRVVKVPVNQQACNFKTLAAREAWEEEFQQRYLTLVFRDVDAVINKSRAVLVNAGKLADKPLERLVYELDLDDNIPDGMLQWDCPYLWKSSVHIDIKHLNQKLEAVDASAGGEGSVLKIILNTENLNLIQHLDTLLNVQSSFIERYCQKIDMADADEITLKEYLEDDYFGEDKIDLYIRIWNKARHFLLKCDHYESLFDYFGEDMSLISPISMCIPSKRGRGRCAYVLMEYLIDKQNSILQICKERIELRPSFAQVDASKCTKKDIICISKKKDLMPLILANHRHEKITEQTGPTHKITYNFGLLEKKIVEKFISRKAEIKFESVPLMLYPQDVGLTKDCTEVLKNPTILQGPLPVRMCHDVDASVENSRTANICEAVRTLTVVIQFLAKLGADAGQTICDYSEKELLLPTEETEMIPRSAQICHCLALYERLSWHRSKRLIQNGQNPFEIVLECAEDIKEDDVIENLKEELKGMNIERLQLELNALMMIGPEMQSEWSLGEEVLLNYLDTKNDGDNSWCKRIPSEVLYKHAAHVFRLSMQAIENKLN